jgi:hypothetical protein
MGLDRRRRGNLELLAQHVGEPLIGLQRAGAIAKAA